MEKPLLIWGQPGCGKTFRLRQLLDKNHFYATCSEFKRDNNGGTCFDKYLKLLLFGISDRKNHFLLVDEFDHEWEIKNADEILSKTPEEIKRIICIATVSSEEQIPYYVKEKFRIVNHTEIKEVQLNDLLKN